MNLAINTIALPATAYASILHRVSGVIVWVAMLVAIVISYFALKSETNFDEGIDGKVTQTIRLMRLDKECPEDSVENLLLDIGLFECPEDHLLINNYTISDWELSSISVVYEYLDCRITSVPHRD